MPIQLSWQRLLQDGYYYFQFQFQPGPAALGLVLALR